MGPYKMRTIGGFNLAEVVSALQKAIRRGQLDDALYWSTEMDLSGFSNYCWRRMLVICSEDIGPANPTLPATIHALYRTFLEFKKKKGKQSGAALQLVHAVILLVNSPKSRVVDNALCYHYSAHRAARREIPDYALDKHTPRGRCLKRGFEHFFEEGAQLSNEIGDDPYRTSGPEAIQNPEEPFEDDNEDCPQAKLFE